MGVNAERVGSAQTKAAAAEVLFVGRFCNEGAAGVFLEVSVDLIAEVHLVADEFQQAALVLNSRLKRLVELIVVSVVYCVHTLAELLYARYRRDAPVEDIAYDDERRGDYAENAQNRYFNYFFALLVFFIVITRV